MKQLDHDELDKLRLRCIQLEAMRDLVRRAVRQGLMAYPPHTQLTEDGLPRPRLS